MLGTTFQDKIHSKMTARKPIIEKFSVLDQQLCQSSKAWDFAWLVVAMHWNLIDYQSWTLLKGQISELLLGRKWYLKFSS